MTDTTREDREPLPHPALLAAYARTDRFVLGGIIFGAAVCVSGTLGGLTLTGAARFVVIFTSIVMGIWACFISLRIRNKLRKARANG